MREKSFIGEKRSKMISWNKTAIMVRKEKTSHGCLIKDGGGGTYSRAISRTLDTVPDTTTNRTHRERTTEIVQDDIRAKQSHHKS